MNNTMRRKTSSYGGVSFPSIDERRVNKEWRHELKRGMACLDSSSSAASVKAAAKGVFSFLTYELVRARHERTALAAMCAKMPDVERENSKLWSIAVLLTQIEDIRKKMMENESSRPGRVYSCYCVKFFNFLKNSTSSLADNINDELRKEDVTVRHFCLFISKIYKKATLRAPLPAKELTTDEIKEGLKMYGFTGASTPKYVDILKRVWDESIRRITVAPTSSSSSSDSSDSSLSSVSTVTTLSSLSSVSSDSSVSSSSDSSDSSISSLPSDCSDSSTSSGSSYRPSSSRNRRKRSRRESLSRGSGSNRTPRKRSRHRSLTRSSGTNRNLRERTLRRSVTHDSNSNRNPRKQSRRRSSNFDSGSNRNTQRRSGRGSWVVRGREASSDFNIS